MVDRSAIAIGLAFLLAAPSRAQVPAAPSASTTAEPDDIVVEGYRKRADLETAVSVPGTISVTRNRRFYDESERMAKCAVRSRLSNLSWLRRVVDGEFNSATHAYSQDRLARIYLTCGAGSAAAVRQGAEATELQAAIGIAGGRDGTTPNIDPFPLGHSIYDRGAYTVQVIKQFAPDLSLTTKQTGDPQVQARYNQRETSRNRLRSPVDYRYFEAATCMVRVEPRLSVRLTMTSGSARFGDVQAALIDRARVCVGGAARVQVDPTQFRLYIADAVYRWAVAAKGVDSLIPTDAAS